MHHFMFWNHPSQEYASPLTIASWGHTSTLFIVVWVQPPSRSRLTLMAGLARTLLSLWFACVILFIIIQEFEKWIWRTLIQMTKGLNILMVEVHVLVRPEAAPRFFLWLYLPQKATGPPVNPTHYRDEDVLFFVSVTAVSGQSGERRMTDCPLLWTAS